jgi:hypothetical protein
MSMTLTFRHSGTNRTVEMENELNFSNSNAADLCRELGIKIDGGCAMGDIETLISSCFQFVNNPSRRNLANQEVPTFESGNFVDCGRREGYIEEKIKLIYAAAVNARKLGGRSFLFF